RSPARRQLRLSSCLWLERVGMCAFFQNGFTLVTKPVGWKLKSATYAFRGEHQVDLAAELVGDQLTNGARPIVALAARDDGGAADFLPFEQQGRSGLPVRSPIPPDGHTTTLGRERAVFCGVGSQLMKHNCHCLTRFRAQYDCWAVDLGIVAPG